MPSGGEVGPGRRGFGLGESELDAVGANIDPTFSGRLTVAFGADNERRGRGGVRSRRAGARRRASTLRVGRFLSGIGYLNEQHAHAWDFVDAPLAYQAFFGGQYQDRRRAGAAGSRRPIASSSSASRSGAAPRFPAPIATATASARRRCSRTSATTSATSASWRARRSRTCAPRRATAATTTSIAPASPVTNASAARSRIWIADAIYKWAPGGNATQHQLQAAGRVLPAHRERHADLRHARRVARHARAATTARRSPAGTCRASTSSCRGGASARATTGSIPARRAVGRSTSGALDRRRLPDPAERTTRRARRVMVDYSPSEFSRFRLQLARRQVAPGRDRQPGLPAVHHEPRRSWCARVLRRHAMTTSSTSISLLAASASRCVAAARARRAQRLRLRARMGRARRRSSAATRSRSRARRRRMQDPHRIEARPSLIARARNADLLVCTGLELEVGWLPLLLQQSGNAKIAPGQPGNFEAGPLVPLLDVPARARSQRRRRPPRRQSAHPARSAQHRAASPTRWRSGWRSSMPPNAATYQQRAARLRDALARGDREVGAAGRAAEGHAGRRASQEHDLPVELARHARGRARSSRSPGIEPSAAHLSELARAARAAAGEDGRARRLPGRARVASGSPSARRSRRSSCRSRSAATTGRRICSALFDDTHRAAARRRRK